MSIQMSTSARMPIHTARAGLILTVLLALVIPVAAQGTFVSQVAGKGNYVGQTARPLRYHPEGTDFLIENGREFFNRPLYGSNTAFRVDAGDRPEFSLYLPGRGGVLRLGLKTATGAKWLFDAGSVTARYRPGSMLYERHDPRLGGGTLHLTALPMGTTEGIVLRVELRDAPSQVELVWAYGGASGERGRRDGDIGTEQVPMSQFFQLKPEHCRDNSFSVRGNTFTLQSKPATLPVDKEVAPEPPGQGSRPAAPKLPPAYKVEDLPAVFEAAERRRREMAEKVLVDTPDPPVNAAAADLAVAGDGG